jgi:hypothetical protein
VDIREQSRSTVLSHKLYYTLSALWLRDQMGL